MPPRPLPPPSPHQFAEPTTFFIPDSFHRSVEAATTERSAQRLFAWGDRKGGAAVVVGVVAAEGGVEGARQKVRAFHGSETEVRENEDNARGEVLAELRPRTALDDGAFPAYDLFPLPATPSSASPLSDNMGPSSVTPILYSPLKHLEVLSLEALRLDFDIQGAGTDGVVTQAYPLVKLRARSESSTKEECVVENAVSLINLPPVRPSSSNDKAPNRRLDSLFRNLLPFGTALATLLSIATSILAHRLPLVGSLSERTAIGKQLLTRFSQTLSLPPTYISFRRQLHSPPQSSCKHVPQVEVETVSQNPSAHASYIRFYNLLWLIANDVIVGFALASFLRDNSDYLARALEMAINDHALTTLRSLLDWLNSWPMGVKLNDELAGVMCTAFHFLSRLWADLILTPLLPHLPTLLRALALLGHLGLGASSLFALTSDLLSVLVLPYTICYVLSAAAYRWSLVALGGLFNVFRGKKYNPLRHRVEPATHEVDQLLLGTILFVTLIFLFPTVLAFYLAFLTARLATLAVYTLLSLGVASLNSFPLFALLLRVKAPGRLPGGVRLEYCKSRKCWGEPHLHLRNHPLSFLAILSSLSRNLSDLLNPTSGGSFLQRLCKGNFV
ncbi:hypothetical protein JCM11251_005991 [Rhodosporidiobolus azoricus]